MSLLPARFQNTDDMPMSLGKAIARAIAPEPFDEFREFEEHPHCVSYDVPGYERNGKWIEEKDCRQIKGAAKASTAAEKVGDSRPLPEAAPPSVQKYKVGDRVRVRASVCKHAPKFSGKEYVICRIREDNACFVDEASFFWGHNIELIPAPEPAATPVALGDGWIEWGGDGCPLIECATRIEVLFRDGDTMQVDAITLEPRNWLHCWDSGNIIAYRVLA